MIENSSVAKQISELMIDIFSRLVDSCRLVEQECSPAEYAAYNNATSRLAASIVFDVMEPLYEKNPGLKPANWDDADNVKGFCSIR